MAGRKKNFLQLFFLTYLIGFKITFFFFQDMGFNLPLSKSSWKFYWTIKPQPTTTDPRLLSITPNSNLDYLCEVKNTFLLVSMSSPGIVFQFNFACSISNVHIASHPCSLIVFLLVINMLNMLRIAQYWQLFVNGHSIIRQRIRLKSGIPIPIIQSLEQIQKKMTEIPSIKY